MYIKSDLDLFSIPNFYIRKGRPHGHRYGKKEGDKEDHTANQLQKKCRKRGYSNIYDRCKEYISNYRKWLRKLYVYSNNINMSDEDNKHDTNYINKNDTNTYTRKLHNQ